MNQTFYELILEVDKFKDIFCDFLFTLGASAVEEDGNCLILRDEDDLSLIKEAILEFSNKLQLIKHEYINIKVTLTQKPNIDWIESYKKAIKPINIGKFYIRPSWEIENKNLENIIIDPALAFGSGHHESTKMCIELISKVAKHHKDNLLDVGCGSGILSICAKKLGVKTVDACDTDEQAIISTKENAKLNSVNIDKIWCGSCDKATDKYDIVVANIIADIILILKNDLIKLVKKDRYLIFSGIINKYDIKIKEKFAELKLIEERSDGEWKSYLYKKEEINE